MGAFERLGWEVHPYIIGDQVPLHWVVGDRSERALRSNASKRTLADLARFFLGLVSGWNARRKIKEVDWTYERFGAFQSLGWWFQHIGIPWILETNELYYINAAKDRQTTSLTRFLRIHEQWAYNNCDVLVCVSQELADLVTQEVKINPQKIVVLPNGADLVRLDPEKVQAKRLFQGPILGFVGHLSTWQRLDMLLEALAELQSENIFFSLVVLGDGAMRAAWETRTVELGLSNYVRFVGRVPWSEVPKYIAGFDLGYAGPVPLAAGIMYLSPLKLYEYAAMGKPIVAAAYSDALRLKADNVPCFLFSPGNKEDLKRALRQAYATRDQWWSMGILAREVMLRKHSWDVRVQQLVTSVEPILKAKYGTPYPARCTN